MLDTKGPEIRTKALSTDSVVLQAGNNFTLTIRDIVGNENEVAVTHQGFVSDVKAGGRILVDDGLIELHIEKVTETDVICKVINTGTLKANKGINLPDFNVSLPALTDKDISDIEFAVKKDCHCGAASFIRSASDVNQIREILKKNGGNGIKIISKIENHQGVDNIDEIIQASDAIMVARGDLGVEINAEDVPLVQKMLISKCNKAGKPVITATQMLESMITNPRPTRAETSDVANAVIDGTDAIMLSGETANGKYPVEAVKTMDRIATKIEEEIKYNYSFKPKENEEVSSTDAITYAATRVARDIKADAIIALTNSGFTAHMISKFKPHTPIITMTPSELAYRQNSLIWGSTPILVKEAKDADELLKLALEEAEKHEALEQGDVVVVVSGMPVGVSGTTNNVRVHTLGQQV
jgi:pyruvate kinase